MSNHTDHFGLCTCRQCNAGRIKLENFEEIIGRVNGVDVDVDDILDLYPFLRSLVAEDINDYMNSLMKDFPEAIDRKFAFKLVLAQIMWKESISLLFGDTYRCFECIPNFTTGKRTFWASTENLAAINREKEQVMQFNDEKYCENLRRSANSAQYFIQPIMFKFLNDLCEEICKHDEKNEILKTLENAYFCRIK